MMKRNNDIRAAAKENRVYLYEIAEKIGVSEPTFNRWLRNELDEPTALAAIEQIRREREIEQQNISAAENETTFCTTEKN